MGRNGPHQSIFFRVYTIIIQVIQLTTCRSSGLSASSSTTLSVCEQRKEKQDQQEVSIHQFIHTKLRGGQVHLLRSCLHCRGAYQQLSASDVQDILTSTDQDKTLKNKQDC